MSAVFSIVWRIHERAPDDPKYDLDVDMAIWSIFLNATLRAAVHLGQDHEANLRYVKNHLWKSVGQLFSETGKLISDQTEITGVNTFIFKEFTWMSTSLLCSTAYQITNAKAYVFSDSVLCVGKMGGAPNAAWKSKIKWYAENNPLKELNRTVGMPTEFEWKIFPGITTLCLLEKIQSLMRELQCEPEHFNDRVIFMSMYNDIPWQEKRKNNVNTIHRQLRIIPVNFLAVVGLGRGSERKRYGTYTDKPDGSWDRMAQEMMENFSRSGHPIFRASSAFERGELRSKEKGKKSTHFNGSDGNIELLLRTVISANQLSVHGAMADVYN